MAHPAALQAYIEEYPEERRAGAKGRAKAGQKLERATAAIHRLNDALIDGRIDTA